MKNFQNITPAASLLQSGSPTLNRLLTRSRQGQVLATVVQDYLPAQVRTGLCTVQLMGTTLVLYAATPAFATKIRYLSAVLTTQLRGRNVSVDRIRVKVLRVIERPRMPPLPCPKMTQKEADAIRDTAVHIQDQPLREALIRLAGNARAD